METSPAFHFTFSFLPFDQLSLSDLYDILKLRQEVFIVEQNCPYLDVDGLDRFAWHVMGKNPEGELLAYSRLLPKGTSYDDYISIGRILTSSKVRKLGLGKKLMDFSVKSIYQLFGYQNIKIGAQTYLLSFYESFGFKAQGETYLEDGIPHIQMIKIM